MTVIDWALYTEQAVGHGAPVLADVINRPLREVLSISGANPDAAFVGFSLVGHTHTAAAIQPGTFTGAFAFANNIALKGTALALGTNGSGADGAAGDITITAPVSTGIGTPSQIHFQTTTHVGMSSGTTPQSLVDVMVLQDHNVHFPWGLTFNGNGQGVGQTGYDKSQLYVSDHVALVLQCGAHNGDGRLSDFLLISSKVAIDGSNYVMSVAPQTQDVIFGGTVAVLGGASSFQALTSTDITATSSMNAPLYKVGGVTGADHNGALTSITVVKGIVTAVS